MSRPAVSYVLYEGGLVPGVDVNEERVPGASEHGSAR